MRMRKAWPPCRVRAARTAWRRGSSPRNSGSGDANSSPAEATRNTVASPSSSPNARALPAAATPPGARRCMISPPVTSPTHVPR